MQITAFVPIKLTNQRLPGKNLLPLQGVPLCEHIFNTLLNVKGIDRIVAYCSDEALKKYLPDGVEFIKRSADLDKNKTKGLEIYQSFVEVVDANIYVLAHATSPFITSSSIQSGLDAVLKGGYDSAFSAERIQTFAWFENQPLNYLPTDIPRTQDIEPVWVETSAFYIFKHDLMTLYGRRIGFNPKIIEVNGLEAVDIDEPNDYEMAKRMIGEWDE